jgi:hypothetical protein
MFQQIRHVAAVDITSDVKQGWRRQLLDPDSFWDEKSEPIGRPMTLSLLQLEHSSWTSISEKYFAVERIFIVDT